MLIRFLMLTLFVSQAVAFSRTWKPFRQSGGTLLLRATTTAAGASSAQRHVLVPMANGSEEIEAVTIIDTLVRGGVKVTSATVHRGSLEVICSRGVKLVTDCHISDAVGKQFDMIVIPGGMPGSEHLRDSAELTIMLKDHFQNGRMIGAICAAPAVVLKTHGILDGRAATGYPAEKFKNMIGAGYVAAEATGPWHVSGSVVTSQGPGTAMPFAIKLIELLVGREKAEAVAKEMLINVPL